MSDHLTTLEIGGDYPESRQSVRRICARYPGSYNGYLVAPRQRGAEAALPARHRRRALAAAGVRRHRAEQRIGYDETEDEIERKWRECRLYQIAPISTNLVLAYVGQHVLGLPRSY